MSQATTALRYAKPLLELAEEKKALEAVKADMENFLNICKENHQFSLLLKNPIIPSLKKLEILREIFSKKFDAVTVATFELIARKNREALLQEIAVQFLFLYNEFKGLQDAELKTTYEVDAKTKQEFISILESITGKKITLSNTIDNSLLGGFVLTVGDQQIDSSVSMKLQKLKAQLSSAG